MLAVWFYDIMAGDLNLLVKVVLHQFQVTFNLFLAYNVPGVPPHGIRGRVKAELSSGHSASGSHIGVKRLTVGGKLSSA